MQTIKPLFRAFLVLAGLAFVSACSTANRATRADMPAAEAKVMAGEGGGDSPAGGQLAQGALAGTLMIYNGSFTLEANEVDAKLYSGQIVDKTKSLGGYLSQRSSHALTVRVPAKEFNAASDYIRSVAKVKYENATAQDITMQYSDLKIRLDVQQKMLARYQELLKKADSVKDAVEVERELGRITERVEQLKGQIRYYDNQVSFSTISVNFQEPYTAFTKETKPGPLGWVFYGAYVAIKWLFVWD